MSNTNEAPPSPNAIARRSGVPFVIAPTGSMAANGVLTLGTALPTTYASAYTYLPAGAVFSGSPAGWYFTQYSSTTVGVVFANTYAGNGAPPIPGSPVAIVASGPGAYTGVTTAVNGPQVVIPQGSFGGAAAIRADALFAVPNNANNKTCSLIVGATAINTTVLTTSQSVRLNTILMNRGAANSNVAQAVALAGPGASTSAPFYGTLDFRVTQTVGSQGQLATATDYLVMEYLNVESGVN